MFVELVYDKRNVQGLEGGNHPDRADKTRAPDFPDASVTVKPMQANGLNSDASKSDRESLTACSRRCSKSRIWVDTRVTGRKARLCFQLTIPLCIQAAIFQHRFNLRSMPARLFSLPYTFSLTDWRFLCVDVLHKPKPVKNIWLTRRRRTRYRI